jgi:hypothetical protein
MSYRDFWQEHIDAVYDSLNDELLTQEEIDDALESAFSVFAGYTQDAATIPNEYDRRKREFYDPINLIKWVRDGGIPLSAVIVHRFISNGGDFKYRAYVSPTT